MPTDEFRKLQALAEALPTFSDIVACPNQACIEMKMDKGTGFGWNLFHIPEIAVAKWFSSAGSVFPVHTHDEHEWIIVYIGDMEVSYDDASPVRLRAGESTQHKAGTAHGAEFHADTWYIAITIPASKGWPT